MMKRLYATLALSVTLVAAIPVEPSTLLNSTQESSNPELTTDVTTGKSLPIPHITSSILYDESYETEWSKVENEECPIIGYKVKHFEIEAPVKNVTEIINGTEVTVQVRVPVSPTYKGKKTLVQEIDVPRTDNLKVLLNATRHVIYEDQVQAYCADEVFPLSEAGVRLRLGGSGQPLSEILVQADRVSLQNIRFY